MTNDCCNPKVGLWHKTSMPLTMISDDHFGHYGMEPCPSNLASGRSRRPRSSKTVFAVQMAPLQLLNCHESKPAGLGLAPANANRASHSYKTSHRMPGRGSLTDRLLKG